MEKYCSLVLKKQIYKHGHLNESEVQTDPTPHMGLMHKDAEIGEITLVHLHYYRMI